MCIVLQMCYTKSRFKSILADSKKKFDLYKEEKQFEHLAVHKVIFSLLNRQIVEQRREWMLRDAGREISTDLKKECC